MSPNMILILTIGVLFAGGVYLMMERTLSRVLIGFILMGNGANLLFLVASGRARKAPFVGEAEFSEMSDPLPQAMVLTAIVITLGVVAFVLAMAYRSWQLHGHDEVQDDLEDRRIAVLAAENAASQNYDGSSTVDEEAALHHDEHYGEELEDMIHSLIEESNAEEHHPISPDAATKTPEQEEPS